jgi:hypothetical protein
MSNTKHARATSAYIRLGSRQLYHVIVLRRSPTQQDFTFNRRFSGGLDQISLLRTDLRAGLSWHHDSFANLGTSQLCNDEVQHRV